MTLATCGLVFVAMFFVSSADPPKLREIPRQSMTSRQKALLGQLQSDPAPQWMIAAESLAKSPNSELVEKLSALGKSPNADHRRRAALVLSKIPSKASLGPALAVAVGDPDPKVRQDVALYLNADGTPSLLSEAKLLEPARKGLEDKIKEVRYAFALILSKVGDKAAIPTLKSMLKKRDHHIKESAAEGLAELGDDSGARVLIKMIRYTDRNHPFLVANKEVKREPKSWARLLETVDQERIRVCGHLEKLKCTKAKKALEKLRDRARPAVKEAAMKALATFEA